MHRLYSIMSALMLISALSFAQAKRISGKVTDSKNGNELPGVTVKVKGTNTGTITQVNGNYELSIPGNATTLIFSFLGYADQEIEIGGRQSINVALGNGTKDISEVVVVGYGSQNKRELTGSVTKIAAKEIANQPVSSFESSIQGKAPGVVIESGSGKLGQGMKIRIRGTSSISASSQPLYVIDGMPVMSASMSTTDNDPTNPLVDINPNDIESVEILKDASAAAIYGARAANGVVLITTKKGKVGEGTRIELNINSSIAKPTMRRKFLDAQQYVTLIEETAVNDGKYDFAHQISGFATEAAAINYYKNRVEKRMTTLAGGNGWRTNAINTDWQDEEFRQTAHTNQIDLSATGGNEKTKYFASGSYSDQEAIVIVNRFKRYGARLNLEHTANSKLSFGVNMGITRSELNRISNDNAFSTPGQLVAQVPISRPYDSLGNPNPNTLYYNGLISKKYEYNRQVSFRTIGNAFLNYYFIPSLSFRSELGTDIYALNEDFYQGKQTQDGGGIGRGGNNITQNVILNTNNYFTFTPHINDSHNLSAVLGMSYLQNDQRGNSVSGENFPSDAVKNLGGAGTITGGSSNEQRYTFLSYFLRGNYNYKSKYLASFSIRTDGSSRFGPKNRYGWFPAGSLGWVLTEENFLKKSKVLNLLKIRASYGKTGNAEIGENNYYTLLSVTNYPMLPGFAPTQLGDPSLHWESTAQTDAGVEFGFFDNRLSGEIDYYNKQTSDLLLKTNVPLSSGFGSIYRNVGSMENKGIEILLNSKNIQTKQFTWTTSLNLAYNKNNVKSINGQIIESGVQRAVEGQPIGVFYMQRYAGVDPSNGDALYYTKDGKKTNDYTQADRGVVGKSNPDWTGGFTNTFSYKGIDLSIFFTFVQGNQIFNQAGQYQSVGFGGGYDNQTIDQMNRWQKPGDVTNVPRLSHFFGNGNQYPSSQWIYDGSYIRLKQLTLGYNLPKSVLSTVKLNSARIFLAGYNLWTQTKYISDPEVNTNTLGNISGGLDFYTVPQAKTVTVGLNVKF
ncbi:MAG: TonB-dependent receptor [Chitinophaga sp.]|uniref:SusC/RagA family TonB-linked outer membrane protein n=1 Tax=Chitinophaga sp. TaxID=1869181 RepID=UPI0025C1654D|nr:TonB-dependent receptor [Chitinophaga sp.]MBV8256050.1 TonB-dependent receptor [Chitinophaga sp.]